MNTRRIISAAIINATITEQEEEQTATTIWNGDETGDNEQT